MERINQELEQYLRVFIDHRQEQWPDWLEIAEFVYNNKIYVTTKVLPFKANYGQDLRMGFEESVRATGHKTPGESSVNITVSVYDTTHLQENSQRIG